jgi:hypothetical protein
MTYTRNHIVSASHNYFVTQDTSVTVYSLSSDLVEMTKKEQKTTLALENKVNDHRFLLQTLVAR